jgi:type IV pilus assembly protein PilN
MIHINLIGEGKRPTAVRKKKDLSERLSGENTAGILLVLTILPGLLFTGWEYWSLSSELKEKTAYAADLQRQYDSLKSIIKEVEDFKKKKAELERKIAVIEDLKVNQIGPVRVMESVSKALPELVWIDRMDVSRNAIRLVGRGQNENAIANFTDNLDKVEGFDEPIFRVMRAAGAGVYTYDMTISYTLKRPDAEGEDGASQV